jgi:hypothetical protein
MFGLDYAICVRTIAMHFVVSSHVNKRCVLGGSYCQLASRHPICNTHVDVADNSI